MKGNPAKPGDPLQSKPTWSNTSGCFTTSVFLLAAAGMNSMDTSNETMARQIAQAASAFEHRRTGHLPKSVSVVLNEETLVITLQGALTPAEKALAKNPAGAAQVQEFHRQLFANSADSLRQEIKRITGVEVCEAAAEVQTLSGTVAHMFSTGAMVQVFLLAGSVPADTWKGSGSGDPP